MLPPLGKAIDNKLTEQVSSSVPPGTTCSPGPVFSSTAPVCSNPQITIAPGADATFTYTVKIDVPAGKPIDFFEALGFVSVGGADGPGGVAFGTVAKTTDGPQPVPGAGNGEAQPAGAAATPPPQACATIPVDNPAPSQTGPLALVKTGNACRDNRLCDFTIAVSNTSANPFNGTVEFDDSITGDDAIFGATTISPAPAAPWSCPKTGQGFKCTANLAIPANGAAPPLKLTFDLGAGIGAVKNVKNCATLQGAPAPSCATVPLGQVQPPAPAPDPNGLLLVKRRVVDKCSDLGGGCVFTVTITNSGAAEFNGPIEFTDTFKSADGKSLPNATLEGGPHLTLAEGAVAAISCAKAGEIVTCGTGGANAKIPAGKTIVAQLSMKPGAAGGATAVRNCARLKSGGGDSCSNIALVNGPLVRLTKFGGGDTCLPRCTFAVVVQNVGNADAKGSFKFKDTFTPASSLGGFNTAPDGAECSQLNGLLFCVPKITLLKPGELTSVLITVFGTAKAPEYVNCVEFVPQPQAPPASLVLDNTNGGRCVTVKDTSPQTPNLVIRKKAPNTNGGSDGHCNLKSDCRFTIEVSNNGLAPFTGPIRVTDTVSLGVPQFIGIGPGSPQSLPWKCDSVRNGVGALIAQSSITCELPALPNGLAPGTTATLEVSVTPGTTWKGSKTLKNCAEITSDGDIGANAIKSDCASVALDPFNVKVSKTGDQQCLPGSNCTFKLTLFNPGPINHNDPVTITDKLTGLSSAQIVSITPPLPCATQPTQIPFTCTSAGPVRLDLDAKSGDEFGPRDFVMVVKLPNDASAEQFSNCATVAGDTGSSDEACVTVATKPAPAGPCTGGMVMTARGCACPMPTKFDGKSCVGAGGINTVPKTETKPVPAEPPPVAATPPPQCRGGMILVENTCACPPNTKWNGRECAGSGGINTTPKTQTEQPPVAKAPAVPSCQGGMILVDGACACPQFMKWNGRACVGTGGINTTPGDEAPAPRPVPRDTTTGACPGDRPVGTFPNCCPQNSRFANGECRCLPGFEQRRGACRPDRSRTAAAAAATEARATNQLPGR